MPLSFREEKTIGADHPCFEGHFPGYPIVPGSLLLEEVQRSLQTWRPDFQVGGYSRVKLLRPLGPGEPLEVVLEETAPDRISFACYCGGTLVASGRVARAAATP